MKNPLKTFAGQRPADTITIVFLAFLSMLTLVFHTVIPRTTYLYGLYTTLLVIQIIIMYIPKKSGFMRFFHALVFPTICIATIFDSLEWIVHYVNPQDIDPVLIRIDYVIFGNHPTVILEALVNPILTEIMQISYTSYYFIAFCFGLILLKTNRQKEFNRSLFLILLCYYLSYVGYILFPALGPRFTLDHLQSVDLKGLAVTEPIQNIINLLEGIKRDAYPSGHSAVTVLVLYLAYRYKRWYFWVCLPVVGALVFSTVYCRYHYVVDVLAGIGLTLLTVLAGEWFYRWWAKKYSNST